MLTEALKEEIQTAFSRLLEEKGYRPRHCQKAMIAEIARTLGNVPEDNSICVVEAGTGTGKTIAYAMASIPIAKQLKKKIVIATATVALQEQIVYQDLPDIRRHSGLEFSFALAKGRRRYLCLSRLDLALQGSSQVNQAFSFFENADGDSDQVDSVIFDSMLAALGKGEWDGERDSWPEEINHATWAKVSTDHAQCTHRQCSHYENCYFYKARENIHRVDCIVTNQDLVLSDLMMGGGAVLPDPEDTIYIFDEGHHLPEKAGNHFSHFLALYSTKTWLQQISTSLKLASAEVPAIHPGLINDVDSIVEQASQRLDDAAQVLQTHKVDAEEQDDGWQYRFPRGRVSNDISEVSKGLANSFERLGDLVDRIVPLIESTLEDVSAVQRESVEYWLSLVGSISTRLSAAAELWHNFSVTEHSPPYARWIGFSSQSPTEGMEIQLSCHPVSVADELFERLWSRCAGAVLTSATLSVARDFSSFQAKSGIPPETVFTSLASPFRYQEQAVLSVPKMRTDPGQADQHTNEIAELLPSLLMDDIGALVLFTSWRQMLRVFDDIDEAFRERILMQGELSKMEILSRHRDAIDRGNASCIFGLASFSEGVDLPGDYCRHVVIAKIPFSVPDDPSLTMLSHTEASSN